MATEDMTLEQQTEQLMNVVVESRKVYGAMCIDYEQKASVMENRILKLQLETIANCRFRPKNPAQDINFEEMANDIDTFSCELHEQQQRMDRLRRSVKDTQKVVSQLKADEIGKRLREPITAEAMLASAKNKIDL